MPELAGISQAFIDRRLTLRLTQETLADLAGVSRYSVQTLEAGTGATKIGSVVEIANVLGLRLDVSSTVE
ncbi:helix-turn-helix domain-containing protein [Mycobacterium sp. CVI_P3]|uniref:Helix-turn-helix domain-containing protein n=1 Tax=Mycobacterium pinniadriaticum TaxID=2994102 RepID=A0ABT3SPH1_9MYCO|nr:helix-turn-helix domain-containing protein [Mycobacterium pinniadriaticum]MCX2934810.1 helix-turn-helix domain-containing protein [Mycobacterium pinniadriaticum]MCX2941232.1 helix-turn-helix domain-containing protein [Mycobacterium pinniadriaticum]